jgi:hypothetical protein
MFLDKMIDESIIASFWQVAVSCTKVSISKKFVEDEMSI